MSVASAASHSELIEPDAGAWPTWLLSSGSELRLSAPPGASDTRAELTQVRAVAAERDTAMTDRITYWDAGAPPYRWTQRAVAYAEQHGMATNRAGRLFALLNVATYDATIAAWDTKYAYHRARPSALDPQVAGIPSPASPSYPEERAVAAGAASTVLAYIFPSDAELFAGWAEEAAQSRVDAGVAYPSDVAAGMALGREVGERAVAWGMADGSDAVWTGSVPDEPGKWKGTNPIEPLAGTWKPWALQRGSQFRPGPPPALDSPQMAADLAEVKNYPRTNLTNLIASFWEYYGGRGSFEYWNDQVSRAIFDYHLDSNPPRAARLYATADVAFQDSFIACWDAKFTYWAPRPPMVDPSITTVFVMPNHPSYPSAHSCISTAVGSVLARAFPRDADYYRDLATQAGEARVMAGIHFRSDVNAGALLGQQVAGVVLERAGDL
ncbi:MAG: vanadium-dependent haloperoxidase [Chloroflexi bacterium]|nr:vanadium-dependent haloperoxidase [Chloroflexota bacterium]